MSNAVSEPGDQDNLPPAISDTTDAGLGDTNPTEVEDNDNQSNPDRSVSTSDDRDVSPTTSAPFWKRPAVIGGAVLAGVVIAVVVIVGTCALQQIGTTQPATVLSTAADGSVLIELRDPDVVNLTDETSFAQSAIVSVRDAPVVRHAGELVFEGEHYSLDG